MKYTESWIYHHGIKGQKWGQRNGPPYPLGASDHSASEKKAGVETELKTENTNTKKDLKSYTEKEALKVVSKNKESIIKRFTDEFTGDIVRWSQEQNGKPMTNKDLQKIENSVKKRVSQQINNLKEHDIHPYYNIHDPHDKSIRGEISLIVYGYPGKDLEDVSLRMTYDLDKEKIVNVDYT